MEKSLTAEKMKQGFAALDRILPRTLTLIVGGGGAMSLAYSFPLATADIDAVPKGLSIDELAPLVEKVSREEDLPGDWLNPWFSTFTHVLRDDYEKRLVDVFSGARLKVLALGKEDLLLMKCFAHRPKDIAHARALVRAQANTNLVYDRIEELAAKNIPGTEAAADFLDQILELEEE